VWLHRERRCDPWSNSCPVHATELQGRIIGRGGSPIGDSFRITAIESAEEEGQEYAYTAC
jgi:hypothetical protein